MQINRWLMFFTLTELEPFLKEGCVKKIKQQIDDYIAYLKEYENAKTQAEEESRNALAAKTEEYLEKIGLKTGDRYVLTLCDRDGNLSNRSGVLTYGIVGRSNRLSEHLVTLLFELCDTGEKVDTYAYVLGLLRGKNVPKTIVALNGMDIDRFCRVPKNPEDIMNKCTIEELCDRVSHPVFNVRRVNDDVTEQLKESSPFVFGEPNTILLNTFRTAVTVTPTKALITGDGGVFIDYEEIQDVFIEPYDICSINGTVSRRLKPGYISHVLSQGIKPSVRVRVRRDSDEKGPKTTFLEQDDLCQHKKNA